MGESDDDFRARYAVLTGRATEAEDNVDGQLKRLDAAGNSGRPEIGMAKEAAVLAALVAREQTAEQQLTTKAVLDRLDDLGGNLTDVSRQLVTAMEVLRKTTAESAESLRAAMANSTSKMVKAADDAAERTDAGTRELARWRKALVAVTLVLAAVAGFQALVMWITPPTVMVIPAPPALPPIVVTPWPAPTVPRK